MYLQETKRRNADGSTVSYLALARNERDPQTGVPRAQIVHRFGRADVVDRDALARLVGSISRFLDPADAVAASAGGEVRVQDSRAMGAPWLCRPWPPASETIAGRSWIGAAFAHSSSINSSGGGAGPGCHARR